MKRFIYFAFIIIILISFAGCSKVLPSQVSYDVPEGEEIQEVLNQMSDAVMAKDIDKYSGLITSSCPQRNFKIKGLKEAFVKAAFNKYISTLKKANRLGEGLVCTVEINSEVNMGKKISTSKSTVEYFFIQENSTWKVADFNFHPIDNPSIVVGSESIVYDSASGLSNSLSSKLYTDNNSIFLYGDVIMVGEPYENASIIDLELRGLTTVRVTDEYPGSGKGVVQVLSGIDNYRYIITIQGSNSNTAIMAVDFMSEYFKTNPYILPGIYIIENNEIRLANPLETSVLLNYDINKAEARATEVQRNIEANINLIENEIVNEKEQLLKLQTNMDNPFIEDFYTAFTRYDNAMKPPQGNGIVMIAANSTDKDLCKAAFELPFGGSVGAIYAFCEYSLKNIIDIATAFPDKEDIWSESKGAFRKESAYEMEGFRRYFDKIAGDYYADASYATALLRLSGFSEYEIFNSLIADYVVNFFNIDGGYLLDTSSGQNTTVAKKYEAQEIIGLENDSSFVNFKSFLSNMEKDKISAYANMLNTVYTSSRDLTETRIKRNEFKEEPSIKAQPFAYNTELIFDMLRPNTLINTSLPVYSSLSEAKEHLRAAMGELLSIKATQALYNAASRYPGSQYDYARFAAGLLNVEHPNVYAQAAQKAKLTQKSAHEIKIKKIDYDYRMDEMVKFLSTIGDADEFEGRFIFPDFCIINKKGSPRDKALLALGLYLNIFDNQNSYVVLGEESAYLAFQRDGDWKFLDCENNTLSDYMDDDIYMAFNLTDVYNGELDLGKKPDFLR